MAFENRPSGEEYIDTKEDNQMLPREGVPKVSPITPARPLPKRYAVPQKEKELV